MHTNLEKSKFGNMQIENMQICKNAKIENANLMKCKFGKLQICKNANLEKWK